MATGQEWENKRLLYFNERNYQSGMAKEDFYNRK
jgi:hypothetical protein